MSGLGCLEPLQDQGFKLHVSMDWDPGSYRLGELLILSDRLGGEPRVGSIVILESRSSFLVLGSRIHHNCARRRAHDKSYTTTIGERGSPISISAAVVFWGSFASLNCKFLPYETPASDSVHLVSIYKQLRLSPTTASFQTQSKARSQSAMSISAG